MEQHEEEHMTEKHEEELTMEKREEEKKIKSIMVHHLIPYFYFSEIRGQITVLRLHVHIDDLKFTGVKFELRDKQVTVSSNKYKGKERKKQYFAKILLPAKVVDPKDLLEHYLEKSSSYYTLYLEVVSPRSEVVKTPDLDVISRHLSWYSKGVREPPDTLLPTLPSILEDVAERLSDLELNDTEKSRVGCYGFACRYKDKLQEDEGNWESALELPLPDSSDPMERRLFRWRKERESFCVEHYLADFFLERNKDDNNIISIEHIMRFSPYWHSIERATAHVLKTNAMALLAGLPSKDFQLNGEERLEVLHSLFDIMLAYAYDFRLTRGRPNTESAWNISKLSATLSWFQVHRHIGDAMDSFMRRSLTYPVCRSWILSMLVYKDALEIFNLGRRQIMNCLVHIYEIFDDDADRKFLNELYIEDYLIWIQQVHPKTIKNYLRYIKSCARIRKEYVFELLPKIEEKAIEIMKAEGFGYNKWFKKSDKLRKEVENRSVNSGSLTDQSSSDSDDSESDSDDSESDFDDSESNSGDSEPDSSTNSGEGSGPSIAEETENHS